MISCNRGINLAPVSLAYRKGFISQKRTICNELSNVTFSIPSSAPALPVVLLLSL